MNNQLEKNLSSALSQMVPDDLYERIERELEFNQERDVISMKKNINQKSVSRKRPLRLLSTAVAACLLLAVGFGSATYYHNNLAVDSIVDIDVNPSIEISTNRKDKVISAVPINEDAEAILDGMTLKNTDLKVAVNAIIGSMVQQGYLTAGGENSILVSVQNDNAEKAQSVRNLVLTDIDSTLESNQVQAAVINQTVESSTEAETFAKNHQISLGKAVLVLNLAAKDSSLDPETLATMSLKDLAALVQEKNIDISDIVDYDADDSIWENLHEAVEEVDENQSIQSAVSSGDVITAANAKEIALKDAGVAAEQATFVKAKLDNEDGGLVYEVEFLSNNCEYEYDIDAATGEILKREIEGEKKNSGNSGNSSSKDSTDKAATNNSSKNSADKTASTNTDSGITAEKAQEIALNHAGLSASEVQKLEVEKDTEHGVLIYDVEFEKGQTEYSYEISVEDGSILSYEKEVDD